MPIVLTAVGCIVMITTLNVGGRYFAMILLVTGPFVGLNVSHPSDNKAHVVRLQNIHANRVLSTPASNLVGDNSRPPPPNQARGPHRLRQLRLIRIALVYAVLLPDKPRAVLPDCRRSHHHGLRHDGYRRAYHEMVVPEEEQGSRGGGACCWSAEGVEICWLVVGLRLSIEVEWDVDGWPFQFPSISSNYRSPFLVAN